MSKHLKRMGEYVSEYWVTATQKRHSVLSLDNNTALFHSENQGILALTSNQTDLRAVAQQLPADMRVVPLLYGDRSVFFRSARKELVKKLDLGSHVGSLWNYTRADIDNGLLLTRLETMLHGDVPLHYFHPTPAMTQDVIGAYTLKPFVFDYTRHPDYPQGQPLHVTSRRYYHWAGAGQRFVMGTFGLANGTFVEMSRKPLELDLK